MKGNQVMVQFCRFSFPFQGLSWRVKSWDKHLIFLLEEIPFKVLRRHSHNVEFPALLYKHLRQVLHQPPASIHVTGTVSVLQPVARKTEQRMHNNIRNKSQKLDTNCYLKSAWTVFISLAMLLNHSSHHKKRIYLEKQNTVFPTTNPVAWQLALSILKFWWRETENMFAVCRKWTALMLPFIFHKF